MNLARSQGEIFRFRKSPLKFEQTFKTPLDALPEFVAGILSSFPVEDASVTIDQVVFEPRNLLKVLEAHGVRTLNLTEARITANGAKEVASLLEAALGDWVDFLFVPTPGRFVLYADHDEWTTIFTAHREELDGFVASMSGGGFEMVSGYTRFLDTETHEDLRG